MPFSPEEIEAFKAARRNHDGSAEKVDDYLPGSGMSNSPVKKWQSPKSKLSGCTPVRDNKPNDWLGSPGTAKRSWKVKSIKKVPEL